MESAYVNYSAWASLLSGINQQENHMWQTAKIVNDAQVVFDLIFTPLNAWVIYQIQIMILKQKQILEMSLLHLFISQVWSDSYSIKQICKECLSL